MAEKPDMRAEGKILQKIVSEARSKKLNFVALTSKDGLVFEADKTRQISALRKAAKAAGGGGQGGWGTLSIEGKTLVLECDDAPYGKLIPLLRKHFADRGQSMKIEIREKGSAPTGPEITPDEQSPPDSEEEREIDIEATGGDLPEPAEDPGDPDDDDDKAAQLGDLVKLLAAARKKDYNFAWLVGGEDMVLKAHRRKPVKALIKAAVQEGSTKRGACGTMRVDGKTVVLTCENNPPKSFARTARKFLQARGQKRKVLVRDATGTTIAVDGDEEDLIQTGAPEAQTAPPEPAPAIPQSPPVAEKPPIEQLADSFNALEPWIAAACASDDKLAGQVTRLSDKVRDSIERGKEGMAIQFMDMLQAELNKVPEPSSFVSEPEVAEAQAPEPEVAEAQTPEPEPTEAQAPETESTEPEASEPETRVSETPPDADKSPIERLDDSYCALESWIAAACASDDKLAAQVTRLSGKVRDSIERGKEGMAIQFMDMLQAELNKVAKPATETVPEEVAERGSDANIDDAVDIEIGDVILKLRAAQPGVAAEDGDTAERRARSVKALMGMKGEIAETARSHVFAGGYLSDICKSCVDAADAGDFNAVDGKIGQLDRALVAAKAQPLNTAELDQTVAALMPREETAPAEFARISTVLKPVLDSDHPKKPAVEKALQSYEEATGVKDTPRVLSAIGDLRHHEGTIEEVGPKMGASGSLHGAMSSETIKHLTDLLNAEQSA